MDDLLCIGPALVAGENLGILARVRERNPDARVCAVASHEDEVVELIDAGAEAARNMYAEAGLGLASEVISYCRSRNADDG